MVLPTPSGSEHVHLQEMPLLHSSVRSSPPPRKPPRTLFTLGGRQHLQQQPHRVVTKSIDCNRYHAQQYSPVHLYSEVAPLSQGELFSHVSTYGMASWVSSLLLQERG